MSDLNVAETPVTDSRTGGWRAKWFDSLNRWMMTPQAYRLALSNPLTRWFVRRRTGQVFDLMSGFVHTQVLLSCVQLRIFSMLRQDAATLEDLAARTRISANALERLLLSAVALRLLKKSSNGRYALGALGTPIAAHAGIQAMVEHDQLLYRDLVEPVNFLRGARRGHVAQYWPYAQAPSHENSNGIELQAQTHRYSQLMASAQSFVVDELLRSYAFSHHVCVMDVGSGKGQFIGALAQQEKQLKFRLFDLPGVISLAKQHHAELGLAQRMAYFAGSFLDDPLPSGADLVTLIRVAHDHPDAVVKVILRKIFDALPAGGTLLLSEPMAHSNGGFSSDAYFHYYLFSMGEGRLRTPQELTRMLTEAGFTGIAPLSNAMPIHTQILIAKKI